MSDPMVPLVQTSGPFLKSAVEGILRDAGIIYEKQAAPEASPNAFEDFDDDVLCFTTPAPGPNHQFTFAAFGDCGGDTFGDGATGVTARDQHQDRVANLIPTLKPQPKFYLVAGEVIYDNGDRKHFDPPFFRYHADTQPECP